MCFKKKVSMCYTIYNMSLLNKMFIFAIPLLCIFFLLFQTLLHECAHAIAIKIFKGKLTVFKPWPHVHKEAEKLKGRISIMEVCGTHTMAISRFGLRLMLPEKVNLI